MRYICSYLHKKLNFKTQVKFLCLDKVDFHRLGPQKHTPGNLVSQKMVPNHM